tara:strand:+ start:988 stop:1206 length:219 start_codon:yes stop_codon:yes gene_type:complete
MKKMNEAGKIRIKSKFLFFKKIKNRWHFIFSFVRVEQIYDGRKWLFNRIITHENVLTKSSDSDKQSERLLRR